jgi:hypothetical protein
MNIVTKVILWIIGIAFLLFLINDFIKYEAECTYKTNITTAIVTNKEKDNMLTCAKPVIFRTTYNIYVTLENGKEIEIEDDNIMYDECEIGDTVNIKVSEKYHNNNYICTYYEYKNQ